VAAAAAAGCVWLSGHRDSAPWTGILPVRLRREIRHAD
jgi:hypothetical protein